MLFTQIEFLILLAAVLAFMVVVRHHGVRKWGLLAASYYFYAYWDWRFVSLLLLSTAVDFVAGLCIAGAKRPFTRRLWLMVSLVVNLGVLGLFKYYNFFVDSLQELLAPTGMHLQTLEVILPIGISFYTFQTLSYTIDVYRRELEPCRDLRDFALFVAFFPQLVAGPIVRASDFLPQLRENRQLSLLRLYQGGEQFVIGLFKKVFIADNLAIYVDEVWANAGAYDAGATWLAVACYTIQIYCDFSGYSDMAIGVARMIGYDLPMNFNLPYLSRRPDEFWRRWHISLSTWLRDYLYIPLGGNRHGGARTYANLTIVMLLGGLWHGANWTFVVWGAWHGLGLALTRLAADMDWLPREGVPGGRASQVGAWLLTLVFVMIGWVFFRSPDFHTASIILGQMFVPDGGFAWLAPFPLIAIGLVVAAHLVHALGRERWLTLHYASLKAPLVLFTMIWLVLLYRPRGFSPFIYFQF